MRVCEKKETKIFKMIAFFERIMISNKRLSIDDFFRIINASISMSLHGHTADGIGKGLWPFKRLKRILLERRIDNTLYHSWGWKEPNSHIYIEYLPKYFSDMKYIHVIRNGLDMAFSRNRYQLNYWGDLYGVTVTELKDNALSKALLEYWIKSNERTIQLGQTLLENRFFLLNFDELCLNPGEEICQLIRFLDMDPESVDVDSLTSLVKKPSSTKRYKQHGIEMFDEEQIKAVRNLG